MPTEEQYQRYSLEEYQRVQEEQSRPTTDDTNARTITTGLGVVAGGVIGYRFFGIPGALLGATFGGGVGYKGPDMAGAFFEAIPAAAPEKPHYSPGTIGSSPAAGYNAGSRNRKPEHVTDFYGSASSSSTSSSDVDEDEHTDLATMLRLAGAPADAEIAPSVDGDPFGSVRIVRTVEDEGPQLDDTARTVLGGITLGLSEAYLALVRNRIEASIKAHPTRIIWDPKWPAAATGRVDTGGAFDRERQVELYGADYAAAAAKKAYYAASGGNAVLAYGWDKLP